MTLPRPSTGPPHADFYHLLDVPLAGRCCAGLACFAARNDAPERWQRAQAESPPLHCLGDCHAAPAQSGTAPSPTVRVQAAATVLLANVRDGGVRELATYRARGGGRALEKALRMTPAQCRSEIERSGLRGRGGAGFAAARKWQAVAAQAAESRYLVVNADEGDPGAFSDRVLLEEDPFRLLEAMGIAAHAVAARHGCIYLRREYPQAATILGAALRQARAAGWLGDGFDVELVVGHGSYLCGEETAMLNAIEGRRPEPRARPPQITAQGLFGRPTLVHNVETLCAVPWIIEHGGAAHAALGAGASRGTKLLSLNSLLRRPGLVEVEFGMSLRTVIEEIGGGLRRGGLLGVMVGGPLAGLLPPALLDVALTYEDMAAVGGAIGHGGVIAFADDSSIAQIVAEVFRFGAFESCGKCTPCRLGAPRIAHDFAGVLGGVATDGARFHAQVEALAQASLCGHGRGLAEFAQSIERHYGAQLQACFAAPLAARP